MKKLLKKIKLTKVKNSKRFILFIAFTGLVMLASGCACSARTLTIRTNLTKGVTPTDFVNIAVAQLDEQYANRKKDPTSEFNNFTMMQFSKGKFASLSIKGSSKLEVLFPHNNVYNKNIFSYIEVSNLYFYWFDKGTGTVDDGNTPIKLSDSYSLKFGNEQSTFGDKNNVYFPKIFSGTKGNDFYTIGKDTFKDNKKITIAKGYNTNLIPIVTINFKISSSDPKDTTTDAPNQVNLPLTFRLNYNYHPETKKDAKDQGKYSDNVFGTDGKNIYNDALLFWNWHIGLE